MYATLHRHLLPVHFLAVAIAATNVHAHDGQELMLKAMREGKASSMIDGSLADGIRKIINSPGAAIKLM
ncbi:MAG: hypothetical protein IPG34_16395 [Rhodocyclaceae bacterium]|nr:hypothetical protein [Rhodocyclaceae bacterium]